jgi:hypothetical protein
MVHAAVYSCLQKFLGLTSAQWTAMVWEEFHNTRWALLCNDARVCVSLMRALMLMMQARGAGQVTGPSVWQARVVSAYPSQSNDMTQAKPVT